MEARARAGSAGKERPEGEEEEDDEGSFPALPLPPFLHDQKWTPPLPAWAAATWLLPTRASACGEEEEGSAPEWPRWAATTAPVEASLREFFVFLFRRESLAAVDSIRSAFFSPLSLPSSPNPNSPNRDHRVLAGRGRHNKRRRRSRGEAREGAAGDCRGVGGGGERHLNGQSFTFSQSRGGSAGLSAKAGGAK